MSIQDKIFKLSKQLYPKGRAFKIPVMGVLHRLHTALARSEAQAYEDALSILDSALPDNDNFTTEDATDWERRLGLITNELVSLSDRKLAIKRKMAHPGDIPARQNWRYLEGQLQAAGFNVYVHENRFNDPLVTKPPETLLSPGSGTGQFGDGQFGDFQFGSVYTAYSDLFQVVQFGTIQMGGWQFGERTYVNKVVNYITESRDQFFDIGADYRSTFYIGGQIAGDFAIVDIQRKDEFRQLILKIKPAQTVAYLFVNYI